MNITTVHIHLAIFFLLLIISTTSLPTECKTPLDLKVQFEKLSKAPVGKKFFLPVEMVSANKKQNLIVGDMDCPTSASVDDIKEHSSCPWFSTTTQDSTVFPSSRTEVICRCRDCLDSDNNHQCVTVYTKQFVLNRTDECIDGMYVYKPAVIDVASSCICADKVDVIVKGQL
ncbi:interleukin 17-like protein [Octopus bimaculoides]|nr:interleukin 17-like protein [Octopus bimaculoides]